MENTTTEMAAISFDNSKVPRTITRSFDHAQGQGRGGTQLNDNESGVYDWEGGRSGIQRHDVDYFVGRELPKADAQTPPSKRDPLKGE